MTLSSGSDVDGPLLAESNGLTRNRGKRHGPCQEKDCSSQVWNAEDGKLNVKWDLGGHGMSIYRVEYRAIRDETRPALHLAARM